MSIIKSLTDILDDGISDECDLEAANRDRSQAIKDLTVHLNRSWDNMEHVVENMEYEDSVYTDYDYNVARRTLNNAKNSINQQFTIEVGERQHHRLDDTRILEVWDIYKDVYGL